MIAFLWADTIRDFAKSYGYTPGDVMEGMTFGRFYAVWCRPPNVMPVADMDLINAKIRKRRKELGLDKG